VNHQRVQIYAAFNKVSPGERNPILILPVVIETLPELVLALVHRQLAKRHHLLRYPLIGLLIAELPVSLCKLSNEFIHGHRDVQPGTAPHGLMEWTLVCRRNVA